MRLAHLGLSGLRLELGGVTLAFDPPEPVRGPVVLTWSETDRLVGVRAGGADLLAAAPGVLQWLGRDGMPLCEGLSIDFAGATITPTAYDPIPYATPPEAMRKTLSALRHPWFAASRLAATLRRPKDPPLVLEIDVDGVRVLYAHQALHRFLSPPDLARLVDRHRTPDVLVAGTDFEDELATGTLMGHFGARVNVVADLIGPVRARLGLPVRPLETSLRTAPAGTRLLHAGDILDL